MKNAAAVMFGLVLGIAILWAIVHVATVSGPNCPGNVPSDWLGFCGNYDGQ